MLLALDAGAEDFKAEDDSFEITGAPEDFDAIQSALEARGIEPGAAEISMIPDTTVHLEGGDAQKMLRLIEALEDHDDVQEVYSNYDVDDDLLE